MKTSFLKDFTEYYDNMSIRKTLIIILLFLLVAQFGTAQNTNSVYSRYAYGLLENPALGKARAMGGLGYGLHEAGLINVLNPASIAEVDTMNMLFDFGLSGQLTSFKEGTQRQQNPNLYLDYVGMKFALKPSWGVALALVPYSKLGYNYSTTANIQNSDEEIATSYSGEGGLNTVYLGTGFKPLKNLYLGASFKYTFGVLKNFRTIDYSSSVANDQENYNYQYVRSPGFDLGLQYDKKLSGKSYLTLGAAAGIYKSFSGEINNVIISSDTADVSTFHRYRLPVSLGFGVSYHYDDRLTLGFDYETRQFASAIYKGVKDSLRNQTRMGLGVEYIPALITDHYYKAIAYRAGIQYSDWYLKEPGHLKSASVSFGLGLPLKKQRTQINLGFEAGRLFTPNASFISENYYKISIDVSFNELWFFKNKL